MFGREINPLKTHEQITSVLFFRVMLFRMLETDRTTEKELDSYCIIEDTRASTNPEIQAKC